MRAICLALVVINILALSVQLFIGAPDSAGEVRRSAPVNGEHSLVMLSERPPARTASAPRRTGAGQSPASGRAPEQRQPGVRWARPVPFRDTESAGHLVQRLQAPALSARRGDIDVPAGPRYWVRLEPELSQNAALRRLHELQGKNIDRSM